MTARGALCAAVAALTMSTAGAGAAAAKPSPSRQGERIARAIVAPHASAAGPAISAADCIGPAGDPAPGTQAWQQRDAVNQYCATERLVDEVGSPAFAHAFGTQTPGIYAAQNLQMLMDPAHPHLTLGQLVPGGSTTDPFRTIDRWTAAGRGRADAITFPAADGATLNGFVFRPPANVDGPYPGIVITTGSIQGYQQMYLWAAEGLAEAGYEVLTYDVQGQGNSDTLPAQENCTGPDACQGVPFQQSYNFFQGTEDALDFFFSERNPARGDLDAGRVGIAGHSLGASAVSVIGQCDPRVKAIVAWDNLAEAPASCDGQADGLSGPPSLDVPALGIASEYFFNPTPQQGAPDPDTKSAAYHQLVAHGTDAMQVNLRSSTHLEYTYVPYILPASRLGERVAFHYTLAWFDRYVKGDESARRRLTETTFDGSADASAIGAGAYDAERAAADPSNPEAGNVPYALAGLPVADRVSIYYRSSYSLDGGAAACADMRAGCDG